MLLQGGYALTLMEQKAGRHYGMGFVVSSRLNGNVKATYHLKPRRGRHGTNLMPVLMQDANERDQKLNCKKDLEHLRAMAADKLWKVTIKRPD